MSSGKKWRESWKNLLPRTTALPRKSSRVIIRVGEVKYGMEEKRERYRCYMICVCACAPKRDSHGSFSFWNATSFWYRREISLEIYFRILCLFFGHAMSGCSKFPKLCRKFRCDQKFSVRTCKNFEPFVCRIHSSVNIYVHENYLNLWLQISEC